MGLIFTLVISLGGVVYAAQAPSVATLEPITDSLRTPLKMALDSNGDIYVADPRSGGVVVLNQYGTAVKVIPTAISIGSVALLNSNNSIPDGKILVGQGNYVSVLDQNGVEVSKLGSGAGQFVKVAGMAVDPNGNIYVADSGAYNVKVFSSSGNYLKSFGSYGAAGGQFMFPYSVSIIAESALTRIAVSDIGSSKVDIFFSDGSYQQTIGTQMAYVVPGAAGTEAPLQLLYPSGVAFDYSGGTLSRMYIVDMYQGLVKVIDPASKQLLLNIGGYGDKRGDLITPSDLLFDPANKRLLVANGLSNIVIFGIDNGQNPVNAVPPVLTIDQPVIAVDVPSVTLTGTVDPGCTLAATVNTSAMASTASFPSAMSWMISVDGLIPGNNIISITAKNSYGTTITKTASIRYTPPTAALMVNNISSLTSVPLIVLTGTTAPGSSVYVADSSKGESGQAVVESNGTWSYSLTLAEGVNYIDISGVHSGATAAFKNVIITLDTLAPVLTVSALSDGATASNQVQNISGTVSDPNLAGVSVNGNPVSVNNGTFSYAIALAKGSNSISVVAADSLGHTTTNTRTINFEPALPIIAITNLADGSFTNQQEITISGTVDKTAAVTVNGVAANPGGGLEWSALVKLDAGMNTIDIAATDQYGSEVKQKRTVVYDAIAPNIAITSPPQDVAVKTPGLTIKGSLSDNTEIQSITATVNGIDKQVSLANGEFTFFADFASEGTYTIAVSVTDMANNVSTAVRTIVFDVTPPALTVDPVKVPYPFTLTGTVEAGASLIVTDAASITGKVTVTADKWTADLSGVSYDPETLVAQATDAAGNVTVYRINTPTPDGDVNGDGKVTVMDALVVLQLVTHNQKPTQQQLAHGDIGPLLNGKVNSKGKLEIVDAILILRKALGLQSW
jgi:hypothetical protein